MTVHSERKPRKEGVNEGKRGGRKVVQDERGQYKVWEETYPKCFIPSYENYR